MERSAANKRIKRSFNPPLVSHLGGVHDTMIKAAKRVTYAILGSTYVTDEDLMIAFTGAGALGDFRPLTYQSASPSDDTPINPNNFLFGKLGGQFTPESVDSGQFSPEKWWRSMQELVQHSWHQWLREWWLPTLNRRPKLQKKQTDIQVNDVVLVVAQDMPLGSGQSVSVVFPGKDKHRRAVRVKVGFKELTRLQRIQDKESNSELSKN